VKLHPAAVFFLGKSPLWISVSCNYKLMWLASEEPFPTATTVTSCSAQKIMMPLSAGTCPPPRSADSLSRRGKIILLLQTLFAYQTNSSLCSPTILGYVISTLSRTPPAQSFGPRGSRSLFRGGDLPRKSDREPLRPNDCARGVCKCVDVT
jgi:hypothetical protein